MSRKIDNFRGSMAVSYSLSSNAHLQVYYNYRLLHDAVVTTALCRTPCFLRPFHKSGVKSM